MLNDHQKEQGEQKAAASLFKALFPGHFFWPGANGFSASCWPFVTTTNTIWPCIQQINQGWLCLTSQACHWLDSVTMTFEPHSLYPPCSLNSFFKKKKKVGETNSVVSECYFHAADDGVDAVKWVSWCLVSSRENQLLYTKKSCLQFRTLIPLLACCF